ncbi:uncharacterized protein [Apostichopus japonicus]|uniref:uncharacterized protein n=1 Tax=Stichopus japonicus TaxID=307972 RepID=UPI003AB7B6FA
MASRGASDGESGVVKRHASDAVKAGTVIINNPESFYDYLSKHVMKEASEGQCCLPFRRSVFYIRFKDVRRNRPNRAVKTVAGTRRLHSIKSVKRGVVATRNISCFCDPCLQDVGVCENGQYVQPWKEVHLQATREADVKVSSHHDAAVLAQPGSDMSSQPPGDPAAQPDSAVSTQSDNEVTIQPDGNLSHRLSDDPSTQSRGDVTIQPDDGETPVSKDLAVGEYVAVQFSQKKRKSSAPNTSVVYMAIVSTFCWLKKAIKFVWKFWHHPSYIVKEIYVNIQS